MIKHILISIIGGGIGYLYYKKIGCASGTCPITSNPYASIIYGIIISNLFIL
ncbi:YtxH domain-containing protein [Clostridium butyricum]|uniref:YtxH domain-containing protein n=1 Tax=Clostridium butyricum TaxID=1492 RepID=A0A6L9ELS6_CLOBU|nr:YtxH domain-containing protein [Clostridium butyricum]